MEAQGTPPIHFSSVMSIRKTLKSWCLPPIKLACCAEGMVCCLNKLRPPTTFFRIVTGVSADLSSSWKRKRPTPNWDVPLLPDIVSSSTSSTQKTVPIYCDDLALEREEVGSPGWFSCISWTRGQWSLSCHRSAKQISLHPSHRGTPGLGVGGQCAGTCRLQKFTIWKFS